MTNACLGTCRSAGSSSYSSQDAWRSQRVPPREIDRDSLSNHPSQFTEGRREGEYGLAHTWRIQLHLAVLTNTFLVIADTLEKNTSKARFIASLGNVLSRNNAISAMYITVVGHSNSLHRIIPHHPRSAETGSALRINALKAISNRRVPSWHTGFAIPSPLRYRGRKRRMIRRYGRTRNEYNRVKRT